MDNLILLAGCLLTGILLQYVRVFPANSHQVLNAFVIYISIPAVALYYIPNIAISHELLFPVGVGWICFAASFLFFAGLGKIFGWSRKLTGCLILTGGLGNTSFVGFPIIHALYGEEGLQTAVLVDQPGTFVVMSTLGITVAAIYSKGRPDATAIAKKVLFFPPFIAFALACIINLAGWQFSEELQSVFGKMGATVTPLALVSVGLQLKIRKKSAHWKFLGLGLLYKLALAPALLLLLYVVVLGGSGQVVQVSIIEAAMAPMITGAIIASTHGLKPKLSSMMIGIGIPLSFLTIAAWYFLVRNL